MGMAFRLAIFNAISQKLCLTVAVQVVTIVAVGTLFVCIMNSLIEPGGAPADSPIVMGLLMFSTCIGILGGGFLACCRKTLLRFPMNHIFLCAFSLAEAILVCFLAYQGGGYILIALGLACGLI